MADLRFDVGCCFYVLIVGENVGVIDEDVDHGRVFGVLTKTADSNAVAAMTCDLRSFQLCDSSIKGGGLRFGHRYCMILAWFLHLGRPSS